MAGTATQGRGHRIGGDPAARARDDLGCRHANRGSRRGTSLREHLDQIPGEAPDNVPGDALDPGFAGLPAKAQLPLSSTQLSIRIHPLAGVLSNQEATRLQARSDIVGSWRDLDFPVLQLRSPDQDKGFATRPADNLRADVRRDAIRQSTAAPSHRKRPNQLDRIPHRNRRGYLFEGDRTMLTSGSPP